MVSVCCCVWACTRLSSSGLLLVFAGPLMAMPRLRPTKSPLHNPHDAVDVKPQLVDDRPWNPSALARGTGLIQGCSELRSLPTPNRILWMANGIVAPYVEALCYSTALKAVQKPIA
jgi:hypothetical protein